MQTDFRVLPIDQVVPSPTNPRTHFDSTKLAELAASILEKGVIEPILVRPMNGTFELVVGERRYRASKLAGRPDIPAMIRELGDVEVLELQVIENVERDDLHPLEEAEGYRQLQKKARYDVQQIADKIGRSGKYVYDRLKLLSLIPELKKLFLEDVINSAHAVILSRLKPEDQRRALEGEERWGQVSGLFQREQADPTQLELEKDEDFDPRKPVSSRELQTWVNRHVRFDPEHDAVPELFPEAAVALKTAAAEELKVVHITRDYRVADDARAEGRTYGAQAWRRADGQTDPYAGMYQKGTSFSECEHSVMGVVVAGEGRGDAFRVCVKRDRCKVHFAKEIREASKRKKERESGADRTARQKAERDTWQEQNRKEQEERKRWEKAEPELLTAIAAALETAEIETVIAKVETSFDLDDSLEKYFPRGAAIDVNRLLRLLAFNVLSDVVRRSYWAAKEAPKALKPWGIDAKAIVDQVAPKPKPEKKPKVKPAAKKKAAAKKKPKAKAAT